MTERELSAALAALPQPAPPETLRARLHIAIQADNRETDRTQDLHIEIFRDEPHRLSRIAAGQPLRRGNVSRTKHRFIGDGGTEMIIVLQEGNEPWK